MICWMVRDSNPGAGKIFRTHPYRPRGPTSILYKGYRVTFPGVKRQGRDADHPFTSGAVVGMGIALPLAPSVPAWHFTGQPLPLTLPSTAGLLNLLCGEDNFGTNFLHTDNVKFNVKNEEYINARIIICIILHIYVSIYHVQ
jgi:hypothetical protein